jgi:hypothetical protein
VDVADLADPFVPIPVVDRTASRGPAAVIGTRVGTRLVATAYPRGPDAVEPTPGTLAGALRDLGPASNGRSTIVRVAVPPGVLSSAQGFVEELPLDGLTMTDGTPAERWAVFVVALDDSGDLAGPVATLVTQDLVGPVVELDAPVTSAVWPQRARLVGTVEAGATVTVDGDATVEMGERGSFTVDTPLAPWPQTLRVVATDQVGNETVLDVTVIGGFDYRILPWPAILAVAVLAAATVSGVVGSRRRRGAADVTPVGLAGPGDPTPELEDLPPRPGA